MGITYVNGSVKGPKGKKVDVRFFVDSGTPYSLLSEKHQKAIHLTPKRKLTFTLADGTQIQRNISECLLTLPQSEGHTPVILGEKGDEPLLGVVTLEILGSVFNPFNRSLHPMQMILA